MQKHHNMLIVLMLAGNVISFLQLKCLAFVTCSACDQSAGKYCDISVGVLSFFSEKDSKTFHHAIDFIHNLKLIRGKQKFAIRYFPTFRNANTSVDPTDSELVSEIDEILASNISVLIGPGSSSWVKLIHPLVVLKDILHCAPVASNPSLGNTLKFPNLVRMVPPDDFQIQAVIDTIEYHKYTRYSIVFSNDDYGNEGFGIFWMLVQSKKWKKGLVRRLESVGYEDRMGTVVSNLANQRAHAVVLLTHSQLGSAVLAEAHKENLTSSNGWLWMVLDGVTSSNLIATKIDNNGSAYFDGVIGTRPAVTSSRLTADFRQYLSSQNISGDLTYDVQKYMDSILSLVHGYRILCREVDDTKNISTTTFRESVLKVDEPGVSSRISFDKTGKISATKYDVLISVNAKWIPIGEWSPSDLQIRDDAIASLATSANVKFHLNVVTLVEKPFVYFADDNHRSNDTTGLQGYCIELLNELSKKAGFTYTLRLVADGQYGRYNEKTFAWNGVIGEVQSGKADLAVASITATEERATVVDFLPAIMDVGLKFIFNKQAMVNRAGNYNPFAFLFPFSVSLYGGILVSVVGLALFLCLISKLSPYGIRGSFFMSERVDQMSSNKKLKSSKRTERQLQEDKKDAERGMGLNNALYFVWAALFWQTPERVPRSISGRVVTIAWYLAAVVFVASYTANMVAVVSHYDASTSHIHSLSDLMLQTELQYGTVANSAVNAQLAKSQIKIARKLHNTLQQNPNSHLVTTVADGLTRVIEGRYALLWDSVSLDHAAVQTGCRLQTVDVGFGAIQYAFAVRKNSSQFKALSRHLVYLQERGFTNYLNNKYFNRLTACSQEQENRDSNLRRLTFQDLAGIFYLVAMSMAVGVFLLIGEWLMVAMNDVNKKDPKAPQTIREGLYRRYNRLIDDIETNWIPIGSLTDKWARLTLPTQHLAQQIIEERLHKKPSQNDVRLSRSEDNISGRSLKN